MLKTRVWWFFGPRVSTVRLPFDHSWGDGPPQLFETMVFGGAHDEWQERYATAEVAQAGHRRVVWMVRLGRRLSEWLYGREA